MFNLAFVIEGDDKLQRALEKLDLSFKDFRPVFIEASKLFYEFEAEAFASEGASSRAGRWAGLTRQYARWKQKAAPGKPLLELTGALKASLTRPNARGSIRRVTEDEMIIGSAIAYSKFLQEGTRKMVARPPIALTEQQERRLVRFIRDGLADTVKRAGFIVSEVTG